MHSRIFQLTVEPVPKDEWFSADDICDSSFIGAVADYVRTQPEDEREDDIGWLINGYEKIFKRNGDTLEVLPGAKHVYFAEDYKKFKQEASSLTLDDFCNDYKMWLMRALINDRFSFYIYDEDCYPKTLDLFMREVKECSVLHIGGIVDYHT